MIEYNGQWIKVTPRWIDDNIDFEYMKSRHRLGYATYLDRRAKYAANRDWLRFVLCNREFGSDLNPGHLPTRYFQMFALNECGQILSDELYWRLLGHILWRHTGPVLYLDLYLTMLLAPRPKHHCFMSAEQRAVWALLPENVTIYRGHGPKNRCGLFYSLSLISASDVATAYEGTGKVSSYRVPKHDLFYLGGKQDAVIYVRGLGDVQRPA